MNYKEAHKRLLAAQTLLLEPSTTHEKCTSIASLIRGINPELDRMLARCEQEFSDFEKLYGGQVIDFALEHLPELTEEQKRRKKAVLFILETWNKLKGEVSRVSTEMNAANNSSDPTNKTSHWGRIFNFAKGPLGIITLVAVGIVMLQQTSVTITIKNDGCGTFQASGSMPIAIPGLKLPSGSIPSGSSAEAVVPPLTFSVDGTKSQNLTLKALAFSASFQLPSNISDVTIDSVSLLHKKQDIKLADQKQHTLILSCK